MLLCLISHVNLKSHSLSNRKFSVHVEMQFTCPVLYQCLQELWMMVAKLLNGLRTTFSRRTRPQMNSTDKWAREIWTTIPGDVQKTWRCQDLPSKSTLRIQVKLHHVISFPHLSLSYPQENQQPVQNIFIILRSDTFISKTLQRTCDSRHSVLNVFVLRHRIY